MRVISGMWKGRRFDPPAKNWPTRPTTDISREALYNILSHTLAFDEISMLDLFGGSGSHSYECISRGCEDVTYVDKFAPAVAFVTAKIREWGGEAWIRIVKADAFWFLKHDTRQYDYIFAGPPYGLPRLDAIPDEVFNNHRLKSSGILVLEHNPAHQFRDHARFWKEVHYGQTHFSFFRETASSLEDEAGKDTENPGSGVMGS